MSASVAGTRPRALARLALCVNVPAWLLRGKGGVGSVTLQGFCRVQPLESHSAPPSLFPGDLTVDFPMPRMPSGPVPRRFPLSRAAQMYQLLCQGVWLHAPAVHSVQGGLCALQDPPASRQDQVLQVHLGVQPVLGRGAVEWGAGAPKVPNH